MTNIDKWLKANRCWKREHNITHARYQLVNVPTSPQNRQFWELVIERLTGEITPTALGA